MILSAARKADAAPPHHRDEAQCHARGVSEQGGEEDRLPGGEAEADANGEAGDLADHAADEAVERGLGRNGERTAGAVGVMGMGGILHDSLRSNLDTHRVYIDIYPTGA